MLLAVREHPELTIGKDAPNAIARLALDQDRDLPSVMRDAGVGDYAKGQYAEAARQRLYLDRIAKADPRQSYDWLSDLCQSDVADAPASDGRRFGHLVLEAMTEHRTDTRAVSGRARSSRSAMIRAPAEPSIGTNGGLAFRPITCVTSHRMALWRRHQTIPRSRRGFWKEEQQIGSPSNVLRS